MSRTAFRLIYPPTCHGCGRMVETRDGLCPVCWPSVKFIERPYCEVLGRPFGQDLGAGIVSAEAIADPPVFDRLRSAVLFDDVARHLVHSLKYRDRTDLAPMMARWMVRAGDNHLAQADGIIPVPLHRRRLMARKFNQAGELARAIADQTGVPYLPLAVLRRKDTAHQVGLTANQRTTNVAGAFRVTEEGKSAVFGRKIVLVDDVYTTGATVNAIARALRSAGASDVTVLTFAMALASII